MDWTVRPHHATNLQGRDFQVQGLYQSQQTASGFSQASASIQNSSAYIGNVQAMKIHSSTENMLPNQISSQNVGSNNFQPPLLKSTVPVTGFGTAQRFVGQHPEIRVQMTSGMAKNTWPNSNVHIISPVAPQFSTANPVQRPANQYIAPDMYNNRPQKNCSNSVQSSVFWGNINSSCSKRLPIILPKHRPANPQTHATVPLNQVSSHFVNSQQNSSYLTFPSGQNVQNQINDVNSGSATAMQSQQYASNCAYSSPYSIPTHYAAQVIPQATDTNLPPSPYAAPPIQINHGQFVLPQPVPNTSNENVQNSQNLALDQSNISHLVQHVQTPQSAPISRETNEVGGAANSIHGHSTENQPFDELTKSAVEALKSICDNLQIPGTVPLDKTSTLQTSKSMVEDYTDKSSGNARDSLTKFKESLTLDMRNILALRKKLLNLQGQFKLKQQLFRSVAQKSKASDPSVHNPDLLLPKSNTCQQTAPLPQATHQTFSLPSHNAAQNLTSLLPHDSAQNQPPLIACSSSQIQDRSLLPLKKRNYSNPILQGLLKGTFDEEMLLNTLVASTEKNQSKQLFSQEMCFSGSVLESSDVKSKTSVSDMKGASRLSPKTSQTVSTQGSLTSTNVSLDFEQISALGKDQLTNMSTMSGGNNGFELNKEKVGTIVTKLLTSPQSTVSVQNPAESSQLSEKLAKEGTKNSQNPRSEFIQQSKYHSFQTTEKGITAWNNQNDFSSSVSLAAAIPEASIVQRSSFTGNSCTMGRTCSLEELETSLALWRKSPAASLNDQLGGSTKPTMHLSSLDVVEKKEMAYTMKNFPNALTRYEKSSITVEKNEPTLSSVSSSLGQKLDAVSSSSSKSSEPQVAIVPPLILSKEEIWNEVQEKRLSSVLGKMYPVIAEGSVHSLHGFVLTSDTDKLVKTACSPSGSCVTVKEVESDMHQQPAKCSEENRIQRAESGSGPGYSCDPNQRVTGPLELEKNTSQLYSRDSYPPGTNKDNSNPVSQKCPPKTNPDLVEPEDTVLNENMLQISSVCTLVQGDASYNSQIANIFNTSSIAEHNISSEDQRPDSYHEEQQLNHWRRESGMNGSTSVGDVLLPSLCTLSKTIAEKLLSLPGVKMPQGGKVSDEVNVREFEEEKNTELVNPNPAKVSEQNMSCHDVHSKDLASSNQEVLGNNIADESSTHGIQDDVPSDEDQVHSVNSIDITLLNDQLTELLKEFPYGIDDSKALKNTENDSATKVNELKDGQDIQTCGQNSEANHELDQIKITILNPQQMKELFPECRSQSSNKLENRENDELMIASENTNESHIHSTLVESTNISTETVQKPAGHSFCCTPAWLALKYAVEPCKHMLAKEAALKQQLVQYLPSKIKEGSETETSSTDCQLNNQQQTLCPISNNLPSEVESNRILSKTFAQRESDLQEKECKLLKDDEGLTSCPFLEKLEPQKLKNKEQGIEEVLEKVQIDELWKQKCTTLVSESQERLYSVRDYSKGKSISSVCEREMSVKKRTPREIVVDKSKSNTLLHRRLENKHSKKEYKIKRDSSETHIIKGPTRTFKRGLKKHIASEGKQKTKERPCSIVTDSSNLSNVDLVSTADNNAQRSQEHVNRQKCKIWRDLENNKTVRTEHRESSSSEPVEQNKGSLARNLKKFAYPEERGNIWKYRRLLSNNINTSKLQTFRGQLLNMNKALSSSKRGAYKRDKCFAKTLSDKKSSCNRKINTLTLQREPKKNYLNKVAFKQTDQSICLTELEQSPSKSAWHVKPSNASEHPENKNHISSSQQSERVKPQMLEFKMCPEIVFRNFVSEDVSDAKKLPEKEIIPVSAVKSRREDWLNYIPQKRRKTDEKETQVDDRIPLEPAMEQMEKNEVIRSSNAIFETFRKIHLKKSRSLDSSPVN